MRSVKNQLIADHDMSGNLAGSWMQIGSGFESFDKFTISLHAESVGGTTDGIISIYVSNDLTNTTTKGGNVAYTTKTVNAADWDGVIEINYPYNYIKIAYDKQNITSGTLNAFFAGAIWH